MQLFTLGGKKYKKINILNINEYTNALCDSILNNAHNHYKGWILIKTNCDTCIGKMGGMEV